MAPMAGKKALRTSGAPTVMALPDLAHHFANEGQDIRVRTQHSFAIAAIKKGKPQLCRGMTTK